MTLFGSLRPLALPVALLSLFVLPWAATVVLMALAALAFPPAGIFIGALSDILYYPGAGAPAGVLWGGGLTLAAYGVHDLLKRRILAP